MACKPSEQSVTGERAVVAAPCRDCALNYYCVQLFMDSRVSALYIRGAVPGYPLITALPNFSLHTHPVFLHMIFKVLTGRVVSTLQM